MPLYTPRVLPTGNDAIGRQSVLLSLLVAHRIRTVNENTRRRNDESPPKMLTRPVNYVELFIFGRFYVSLGKHGTDETNNTVIPAFAVDHTLRSPPLEAPPLCDH